ncbi:MAG: peptide-modifying radical SAM enzyme CbpB [Deltaproteobacteria bacterium]|nr:peptide-modifying radical SAM enzyme CbpB [Deltaproteobacteria bacterium]
MKNVREQVSQAASRGIFFNTGNGPSLQPIDIGHDDYIGLVDPEIAFWSLIRKDRLSDALAPDGPFMKQVQGQRAEFKEEMRRLRFGLKPTAVYFNPTDRCNLNCTYCYIPEDMRREGVTMSPDRVIKALGILREFFKPVLPEGVKPQIVFHGAEPMLAREAIFAGMDQYKDDFRFGVQTNGSLLDAEAIEFLTSRGIGIGLSLDSSIAEVADRTRQTWGGSSVYAKVCEVLEQLQGYPNYNVICTVTGQNMESLVNVVDFYHERRVPVCMLNPVRCTRQGARDIKPKDKKGSRSSEQTISVCGCLQIRSR